MTFNREEIIASATTNVHRRFGQWVSRDDLYQEAELWWYSHPSVVSALEADENQKRAKYRLRRDVMMALEIFARKEKAAQSGYDASDEYFYSPALIEMFLPAVVFEEWEPPQSEAGEIRSPGDPAEGGSWMAILMDVRKAWESSELTIEDRSYLLWRYVEGYSFSTIAELTGAGLATAHKKVGRATDRFLTILGGIRPSVAPSDAAQDEVLRRRPGSRSRLSGVGQLVS